MFPDIISASIGIVLIGFLWIGVDNRHMLLPVSIFAIILLFPATLIEYFNQGIDVYYAVWAVGGIGLLATYIMRLRKKPGRSTIDYFKFSAVVVYGLYLFPVGLIIDYRYSEAWAIIAIGYVVVIYAYDRLILKSANENRRYVIALSVQTLLIFWILVYALTQRTAAIRNEEQAIRAQQEAERQAQVARQQEDLARKALEDCQQSK